MSLADEYRFSNDWFASSCEEVWDKLLPGRELGCVLEIGCFEGAGSCYLVRTIAARRPLELHCIDSWEGGLEHQVEGSAAADMPAVEARFRHNLQRALREAPHPVDLRIHKSRSGPALATLLAAGREGSFDFIYVDGSHEAPDVLTDAVLAFQLLKVGGVLGFDDYWWHEELPGGWDPIRTPKLAIDSFTNIFCRKLQTLWHPNHQVYVLKTAA